MKELMLTGFMSNRGRQNVASFLTKGVIWLSYSEVRVRKHNEDLAMLPLERMVVQCSLMCSRCRSAAGLEARGCLVRVVPS